MCVRYHLLRRIQAGYSIFSRNLSLGMAFALTYFNSVYSHAELIRVVSELTSERPDLRAYWKCLNRNGKGKNS